MFLKSLELFGFKSFADRTMVEFADGISALLGPNGCGKSNVVDAIKWVVGEQSPRSLRADSMEDIIFNGTETRKALSVAEVTITFSNEKGLLSVDLPEIAIKRRLYRSGESEYYINGQQAKLKELRELFWDTGIGKSAYSVMEQGKIDQILSSKPEERRYLFEEAAGITKHRVRSREAELKLEKTEENVRQVQGVLAEVKRSHDSLKVQADKTLKYRELKDKAFEAELDLHLLRLRGFVNEKERRDEEITGRTRDRDKVKGEIDAINLSLEESLDLVNGMEASLVEHQKTIYGLAVERAGKEKERKLLSERVVEGKAKIAQALLRRKAAEEKLAGLVEDADEKDGEAAALRGRLAEIEKNIAGFEASVKASEARVKENESSMAGAEAEILDYEAAQALAQKRLDAVTDDIASRLDARLKESGYSIQDRARLEEAIEGDIAGLKASIDGKAALVGDLASLEGYDGAEARSTLSRARDSLVEASELAGRLASRFAEYKAGSPSFIAEFLSPEGVLTRKRAIDGEIRGIKEAVAARRSLIASLREENKGLAARLAEYRGTLEELRGNRIRIQTQVQAAEAAIVLIRREIVSQETYLKEIQNEVYLEEKRLAESEESLSYLDEEIADIEKKGRELTAELERLEKDIALRNAELSKSQGDLKRRMESLAKAQSDLERLHLGLAQVETEIRVVKENFREQFSRDLSEFEERMYEIRVPTMEIRDALNGLRGRLKELGSVNLMAPEEYAEVKERYDFLSGQLADLEKARADLARITEEIRAESAELFLETYNKIKKNFHNMFRRLFGGGRGELRLADPNHVLESGIEILAQPPGKKLESISLLSGGEKSLTAIGLLFATYMVRPSPFCFLDEIDAALDEGNVIRFVNLLREFGRSSQFIVITHNKKTVTGADALLGVTMEESGITKVIAVRLERSEGKTATRHESVQVDPGMAEEEVGYEEGMELPPGVDVAPKEAAPRLLKARRERKGRPGPAAGLEGTPLVPLPELTADSGLKRVGEEPAAVPVPEAPGDES